MSIERGCGPGVRSIMLRAALTLSLVLACAALCLAGSNCLPQGTQLSGALYLICMPDAGAWNGNLVVYAHGYTAFNEPIAIPDLSLPDGTSIPQLVNGLGYGFAVSSFSVNGLAVVEGVSDMASLVRLFHLIIGPTQKVYLVGASEGGLITALSMEKFGQLYSAGLPACGPIGSFRAQVDYFGDFRVIFDYFFPGLIPGSPINIPDEVINNWDTVYVPRIEAAVAADPSATAQLMRVTHAAGWKDPDDTLATVTGILWYNVFATNDGVAKLHGQPFDNQNRIYKGSDNDLRLNLLVERFSADPAALIAVATGYETSGNLLGPVVALHTMGDPIIPWWHESLYHFKVVATGEMSKRSLIPVRAYGHCNFTTSQVLLAFALMVLKESGQTLPPGAELLVPENQRQEFLQAARAAHVL